MTQGSLVAIWAYRTSWFTPTSLFLLLNLMIGTVALRSRKNPPQQPQDDNPTHQLFRTTSLLHRVKSINFNLYQSESSEPVAFFQHSEVPEQTQYLNSNHAPPHQLARSPSFLDRVKSFNLSFKRYENSDAANETQYPNTNMDSDSYTDNAVRMTESESDRAPEKMKKPVSENLEKKSHSGEAPAKMKKSASEKIRFGRAEEEANVERRRPATVREERKNGGGGVSETVSSGDNECVNVKADDFINRFRQQLMLQRLDSLLRYKEMINRGSSN